MIFIKVVRKNQIIVFILALLLVTVGYISYKPGDNTQLVSTTLDNSAVADIGDATLVSSSSIVNTIEHAASSTKDTNNTLTNDISDASATTTASNTSNDAGTTVDNYFADTKLERERMYSQSLDDYQQLADNPNIPATQKSIITNEITKINNLQNSIMIAENLIMNKGVDDVVILVNSDNSVNVIVKTKDLSTALVAQIQNIVTRELNAKIENVHISSR
ncbi:MAG: SpoIIIAH-like family protein [Oscillospiraceae bacterium]|nr:SpoIIIAH-like family protein [Oscillospiraceae bacterium]